MSPHLSLNLLIKNLNIFPTRGVIKKKAKKIVYLSNS